MTRTVRSRRAEMASQPLYARVLRLRHLAPSGLLCFVFLEGAVVLGILLALAELVSWWGVLVLPVTVALMVKLNDLVAGTFAAGPVATEPATARAAVLRPAAMPAADDGWHSADAAWHSGSEVRAVGDGVWQGAGAAFPAAGDGRQAERLPAEVRRGAAGGAVRAAAGGGYGPGVYGTPQGGGNPEPARPATGARRPWADQLDVRQQVARQAAARRYE